MKARRLRHLLVTPFLLVALATAVLIAGNHGAKIAGERHGKGGAEADNETMNPSAPCPQPQPATAASSGGP